MMAYYIYIMANKKRTLYIGITSNLEGRVLQHKSKQIQGFTKKYDATQLVYYEEYPSALEAIAREKQMKAFRRSKKIELIAAFNPQWHDLAEDWNAS